MRIKSGKVIGLTGVLALTLAPISAAANAGPRPMDARAAVDLSGRWEGYRTDAATGRKQTLSILWSQGTNGEVTGVVSAAKERAYPVTVVWASGTKFIIESAPHLSPALHERVVVRTVAQLDGDAVRGTYEMRPTTYRGWTATGHVVLHRMPPGRSRKL